MWDKPKLRNEIRQWMTMCHDFLKWSVLPLIITFVFSIPGISFALPFQNYTGQFLNHTSQEYQIQFQYPSNWCVFEENESMETPSMSISDQSGEGGYIRIWINPLSEFADLVPNTRLENISKDVSDSIVRKVTEMEFPLKNNSESQYYLIGNPSYLSIDGHLA
jgi:hypothetical protein